MSKVTVVVYHYVREILNSRYPDIKGLEAHHFIEQVEYFAKNYNIVNTETVILHSKGLAELPPKALLLTFDDAYIDHFDTVMPILANRKISGAFYAPVLAVKENRILDVNKIHFILASEKNKENIIKDIFKLVDQHRDTYKLFSNYEYFNKYAEPNRFDTKEVIFIKRMLQVALPEDLRNIISDKLFSKYVSSDEKAFSRELYMNEEQLKFMVQAGMHIGSHGNDHYWLASLEKDKQQTEIENSLEFLKSIGVDVNNWTISYPYGNYNSDTLDILKEKNCNLGFTTKMGVVDFCIDNLLELPRLDTNDFPKNRN